MTTSTQRLPLALLWLGLLALLVNELPPLFAFYAGAADPDPRSPAITWSLIIALWLVLLMRARGPRRWELPSQLFRATLALGTAVVVFTHALSAGALLAFGLDVPSRRIASAVNGSLYDLGVLALGSLAAFATARSLIRPLLAGTHPPETARDISLSSRFVVASAGASFATGGILLELTE